MQHLPGWTNDETFDWAAYWAGTLQYDQDPEWEPAAVEEEVGSELAEDEHETEEASDEHESGEDRVESSG